MSLGDEDAYAIFEKSTVAKLHETKCNKEHEDKDMLRMY